MRIWKLTAGSVLLMIGMVASFKCLGDIKRPLLGDGPAQHSIAANVVGWLLFGLIPLVLSRRLWQRDASEGPERRRARTLATLALVSTVAALGFQSLIAPAKQGADPPGMWHGLLVILPISVSAVAAAAVSFVLAMISTSLVRRVDLLQSVSLIAAAGGVVVTSP